MTLISAQGYGDFYTLWDRLISYIESSHVRIKQSRPQLFPHFWLHDTGIKRRRHCPMNTYRSRIYLNARYKYYLWKCRESPCLANENWNDESELNALDLLILVKQLFAKEQAIEVGPTAGEIRMLQPCQGFTRTWACDQPSFIIAKRRWIEAICLSFCSLSDPV